MTRSSILEWPFVDGEMAERIRSFDWSPTPLGPIVSWPQSLRTSIDIMLAMPGPATIFWGAASIQLYNDAYRVIARERHPDLLGRPVVDGWLDAYDAVISPLLNAVWAGNARHLNGFSVRLNDAQGETERIFDIAWSPIRGEDGAVAGALQTLAEVTERHRADAALRASEERFRALATAGAQLIYRMSPDWRQMRQMQGRSFLTDISEPTEDWADAYFLDEDRPAIFAAIDTAIRTKSIFELEHRVRLAGGGVGWVLSRAVPRFDADGEITEWFGAASDVTGRKLAEAMLREGEKRQAFLLELSDALRPLSDPARIQVEATRILGGHLGLSRVFYAPVERRDDGDVFAIDHDFRKPGAASIVGTFPVDGLGPKHGGELRSGRTVKADDLASQTPLSQAERDIHASFRAFAYVSVPLVKNGDLVALMTVHRDAPHEWTPGEIALIEETAERTWAAVERAQAEAARHASERRLASVFEALPIGVGVLDTAGLVVMCNNEMRRFMPTGILPSRDAERRSRWRGWRADGSPIEPNDFPGARALRGERVVPGVEMLHAEDDGREAWTRVSAVPLRDDDGRIVGHTVVVGDIDDLKRAAEALQASEERFRSFAENSTDVLWIVDAATRRLEFLSPSFERIWGESRENVLADLARWGELVHPDDREFAFSAMPRALAGESRQVTYRITRPSDGSTRWIQDTGFAIRDETGAIRRIGGIAQDITAARELEERQHILFAELQHRTRNLVGVVRSIADRTAEDAASMAEFLPLFRDRLGALSRINSLLSGLKHGERITFAEMIRTELEARGAFGKTMKARIVLDGPEGVRLRSAAVQTFALAIHELTTNAVKYGALSAEAGRLTVRWRVDLGRDGAERLRVEWIESDVAGMPPDDAVPKGGGYGRRLIEKALPYQLRATTRYEFGPDGVRCTIDLPLS